MPISICTFISIAIFFICNVKFFTTTSCNCYTTAISCISIFIIEIFSITGFNRSCSFYFNFTTTLCPYSMFTTFFRIFFRNCIGSFNIVTTIFTSYNIYFTLILCIYCCYYFCSISYII